MTATQKRLAIIIPPVLIFLMAIWLIYSGPNFPLISISFAGYTNSATGKHLALFVLRNNGDTSVRRQEFCTTYWTNSFGASKDAFVSLSPTNFVLRPGHSEMVSVTPPPDGSTWRADFAFAPERGLVQYAFEKIQDWVPWLPAAKLNKEYDVVYIHMGLTIEIERLEKK